MFNRYSIFRCLFFCALFFTNLTFCMKQAGCFTNLVSCMKQAGAGKNTVDSKKLGLLVNCFFVKLIEEFHVLGKKYNQKSVFIDDYIKQGVKFSKDKKANLYNEFWEFTVMERTSVSRKLENKEPNTIKVFDDITAECSGVCKAQLLKELKNPDKSSIVLNCIYHFLRLCKPSDDKMNTIVDLDGKIEDLLKFEKGCQHVVDFIKEEQKETPNFYVKGLKEHKAVLKKIIKEKYDLISKYSKEIGKCKEKVKSHMVTAHFFINQFPELRSKIFSIKSKDKAFNSFMRILERKDYSCYSPDTAKQHVKKRDKSQRTRVRRKQLKVKV